jgi:hypothetical protein
MAIDESTTIPADLRDLLQQLGAVVGEALVSRETDDEEGLNVALDRAGELLTNLDSWIYPPSRAN